MKLSIVVLNYKTRNLTKYFLKGVLAFKFPWTWEIIVVDNDSGDGLKHLIKTDFPVVKLVQSPKNVGMGWGNNLGIEKANGKYVLVANPDITLNQKAIVELVDFMDHKTDAGLVGPLIKSPDGSRQETCYRWPKFSTFLYRRTGLGNTSKGREHLNHFLYRDTDLSQSLTVDWVLGGCFLARRSALESVGLFDRRFFLFLEDTDLCRRLWQQKFSVWYYPLASVIHLPHRLSAGSRSLSDIFSKMTWIHIVSWLKYFWKWRNPPLLS
ncbi:MAG TPA: glycosyltransferase family 2 protein [Patescibacteria group bacterium]|nr:glycosyltransferase family 2 protein [Patescibacteria group bacterium]